jgi:geranylgeranyl diphosphate synthase type I
MNFGEFRTWFDEQFSFLLEKKIRDFIAHGKNSDITPIVSYITSIAKNGKRFRPFLVYSASNLNKKNANDHFLLFASVELLHIFALIHDDIMDEADMRHGVICAHKKFTAKYGKTTSQSIGILLGDLVFAWAYECLFEYTSLFPNTHHRITQEFTQLVSEVTYGQILDVLSPSQKPLEEKAILEKMILKTARYSFVRPLLLGFVLSGDQTTDHEFAEKFGLALGIGFQLQDDLLDTLPTEKTGKSQFSDIQNKNQTLLSHYLFQSKPEYSNKLMLFWGKTLVDENDRQSLTHILVNSGAIDYIKKLTTEYFNKAQTTVTERDDSDQPRWKSIIELIENRKK